MGRARLTEPSWPGAAVAKRPSKQTYRDLPVVTFNDWDTVDLVRQALAELERGLFRSAAYLVDSMMRDDRVYSVVRKRIGNLLALPLQFDPPADTGRARKVAAKVEKLWPVLADPASLNRLHKWGTLLGIGVAERIWDTDHDGLWVPRLKVWHPSFLWWRIDTRTYWVNTMDGPVEIPEPAR